ncbi:hypothetical protein [Cyanobium sp. ULC084]
MLGKISGKAEAQSGTSDPFWERGTLKLAGPDQWHSIGDYEIRFCDEGFVSGKPLTAKQVIKVGCDDVSTLLPMQGINDLSASIRFGDRIYGYALKINSKLLGAIIRCLPATCNIRGGDIEYWFSQGANQS